MSKLRRICLIVILPVVGCETSLNLRYENNFHEYGKTEVSYTIKQGAKK